MEKKIEINLDEQRSKHLFIATPAYGGGMHCSYVTSILQLQALLHQYSIPHTFQFMFNESLISRARNKLADMFLANAEATDLLFIDADIEFNPSDVLLMRHFDMPVIGGAYPLKTIDWEHVKKAMQNNPDISAEQLAIQGARWGSHPFQGKPFEVTALDPVPVQELATGFMLIKRGVFETLAEVLPSYEREADNNSPHERLTDFFRVGVFADRYESEDYSFCREVRQVGGTIHLCPWIKLNHHGSYSFKGDMSAIAGNLNELH